MNTFLWVVSICGATGLAIGATQVWLTSRAKSDAKSWLDSHDFNKYATVFATGDAIGADYERRRFGIVAAGQTYLVNFDGIISTEIVENGQTVTRTSRGSQLAGAAIGGIALGGVGAIIGGLSGGSRSATKTTRIAIRIITDSPDIPLLEVRAHDGLEIDTAGIIYRHAMSELMPWFGRFKAVLESA